MITVTLEGPTDVAGFRRHARALVGRQVPPSEVDWLAGDSAASLWSEATSALAAPAEAVAFTVPAGFVDLCHSVLLHRDPQRFALMYQLLWLLRQQPDVWHDRLHPERRRAEQWAREVRHDLHQMRAFVRFTPVDTAQGTRHIAWFEPDHHVVQANATFFVRRFAQMRWAILTPDVSLEWDGTRLITGPGGDRRDTPPPDAGAALWLTYYQHTFNPARLKVDMMEKEMPRRFWANLPEAVLIEPLVASAAARTEAMVQAGPTTPRRVKPIRMPAR